MHEVTIAPELKLTPVDLPIQRIFRSQKPGTERLTPDSCSPGAADAVRARSWGSPENDTNAETEIADIITAWAKKTRVSGKSGKRQLQPSLAVGLREAGFTADEEDQRQILRSTMPVWRSKDDQTIEATIGRRRIDIVVYRDSTPIALIETESDLNDLRTSGVTRRNGHYDVWSIARSTNGSYFDSYKSLERMAAAAFYWYQSKKTGGYPSVAEATQSLEAIRSNEHSNHNPGHLALFLVSGSCRTQDNSALEPRLRSLGAQLICVSVK